MKEISTNIHDAKTHLSKYLVMLENREIEKLIIKRRDQEVGELVFRKPKKRSIIFGMLKGQFECDEDDLHQANEEIMADFEESIENTIRSLEEGPNGETSS